MRYGDSAERFAADTAEHQMTILHNDGLYRHVRFQKPGTSFYYFDLMTWPGSLAIRGDMDSYLFSRNRDMFEFFRSASGWNAETINPRYWAEKLEAKSTVKEYSEDLFRQLVEETVADAEDDYRGLKVYTKQELQYADDDGLLSFEETARQWLRDFKYVVPHVAPVRSFEFLDTWEWNLAEYSHHYLWACHAIQWGIEQYDKARVPAEAGAR